MLDFDDISSLPAHQLKGEPGFFFQDTERISFHWFEAIQPAGMEDENATLLTCGVETTFRLIDEAWIRDTAPDTVSAKTSGASVHWPIWLRNGRQQSSLTRRHCLPGKGWEASIFIGR